MLSLLAHQEEMILMLPPIFYLIARALAQEMGDLGFFGIGNVCLLRLAGHVDHLQVATPVLVAGWGLSAGSHGSVSVCVWGVSSHSQTLGLKVSAARLEVPAALLVGGTSALPAPPTQHTCTPYVLPMALITLKRLKSTSSTTLESIQGI